MYYNFDSKNFKIKKDKDIFLLFSEKKKRYYALSILGYYILDILTENKHIDVSSIKELIAEKYPNKKDVIKKDVDEFIEDCLKNGILKKG